MIKIGLTGGIGSGKSVVAALLEVTGIPVYIADTESKRLLNTSPLIREQLVLLFGKSLYMDGEINKKELASLIFTDPERLKQVNNIIHPIVKADFQQWASRQHTAKCAIESAILFESGFDKLVDITLMVYAPLNVRLNRVATRDNVPEDEIRLRIENQMPDEAKKELANLIIYNDGHQALIPQLENILLNIF